MDFEASFSRHTRLIMECLDESETAEVWIIELGFIHHCHFSYACGGLSVERRLSTKKGSSRTTAVGGSHSIERRRGAAEGGVAESPEESFHSWLL
ncbi:hypothetical protein Q1695_014129 [Nippostrongylus brasiliensis]|nr:hypothetical protein Q1695_014129 [Nippostrongylus brasiliensis]